MLNQTLPYEPLQGGAIQHPLLRQLINDSYLQEEEYETIRQNIWAREIEQLDEFVQVSQHGRIFDVNRLENYIA